MYTISPTLFSPHSDTAPGAGEPERDRFVPMLAVHETPTSYEIEIDLPFATAEDVEVRAHENDVVVRCTRAIDQYAPPGAPDFGTFVRRIHFAHRIDARHVVKRLEGGVLRVFARKIKPGSA